MDPAWRLARSSTCCSQECPPDYQAPRWRSGRECDASRSGRPWQHWPRSACGRQQPGARPRSHRLGRASPDNSVGREGRPRRASLFR
eukprot:scaffold3134_cov414-Prasinococcus_capsulatus_cf.AAC.19